MSVHICSCMATTVRYAWCAYFDAIWKAYVLVTHGIAMIIYFIFMELQSICGSRDKGRYRKRGPVLLTEYYDQILKPRKT